MDRARVDRAVMFPFVENVDSKYNDWIADTAARYPDRLIGFAAVNPWHAGAADEVRRAATQKGLRGLKLHPFLHGYSLATHELMDPIFQACRDVNIPLLIHGGDNWSNMPYQFDEMARTFPDVTMVMAHMGTWAGVYDALQVAQVRPNILLGTAMALANFIVDGVKLVGPDRVVMETDSPAGTFETEMAKIEHALPDRAVRELVMGGNLARVLGIG